MDDATAERRFARCYALWAAATNVRSYKADPNVTRPQRPTTPKTFIHDHTKNLTSEDYESFLVLTETTTRHRYALRLRHPVRAIRYLTRRALHLAA